MSWRKPDGKRASPDGKSIGGHAGQLHWLRWRWLLLPALPLLAFAFYRSGGVGPLAGSIALASTLIGGILILILWHSLKQQRLLATRLDSDLQEQQTLQDNAAVGIALINEHRIVRCNRGLEDMMGYADHDLNGQLAVTLFPSQNAYEETVRSISQALAGGETTTGELIMQRKDRSLLWCDYQVRYTHGDNPRGWTVVLHDISKRKTIEASLKQALQEQQAIFDNAHAGIVFLKDRVVQRCNEAFERMLGYGPGELTGQSARIYYPNEQLWLSHGILWYPSNSLPQSFDEEWQYQRKDGSHIWCSIHSKLIDPKDSSKGVIALNLDITARKLSQVKLVEAKKGLTRSLIEVAEQKANMELAHRNISILSEIGRKITATLDSETIMTIAYRHVRQLMLTDIFGIGMVDEERGVLDCAYTMAQNQRCQPYTRSLQDPNQLSVWCLRNKTEVFINDFNSEANQYLNPVNMEQLNLLHLPNRQAIPMPKSMIYVPLLSNDRVLGVIRVASFTKKAYERVHLDMLMTLASYAAIALDNADTYRQLQSAQQQLIFQEKMASLGTLTAGVAHEINNPANFAHLGTFNLKTELNQFHQFLINLAGDDAPADLLQSLAGRIGLLNDHLATITEGTTRIRDLVKDLRTFSRLDEAEWKSVPIIDSLSATINLVRTQYATTAEIRCHLATNPMLDCCPAQLNQVFMNLIVNACQAIASRQLTTPVDGLLEIRSWEEAGWLVLEFEDNGGGMSRETQAHIFEPFFTTKSVGEGTGLGLSISFGIIEKHRGTIAVRSQEGEGTCFTLRLPLAAKADETIEVPDEVPDSALANTSV
jgi:PAS domain S-box-containing protein